MYIELKKIFNKLNTDINHYINSNDICTPMDCVEEMVNAIPNEFWSRDNIKILDPCAGNGNFPLYIQEKLKFNDSYRLYLNEINPKRIENIKKFFTDVIISTKNFFEFKNDEKFDLIIANPPYAKIDINGKRAAKNHNVSRDFVKKAIDIVNDDGYIVFIIPDNWMSLSDRNDVVRILSQYQFIHLNIHKAKKYFPGIGSNFTWFVLKKSKNTKKFLIENSFVKEEDSLIKLDEGEYNIPLFYNHLTKSIISKTLKLNNKKMNIETTSDLHRYTKKLLLSINKDDEYKYKIIHTSKQTVWSKIPHKFQDGWKVFIVLTSYYSTFIDECGMTQSIAFIRCETKKEAEKLQIILNHPLYIFLNNIHRYGNFNNIRILQKFPMPNTNDVWSSFNINEEEKDFILDFIN